MSGVGLRGVTAAQDVRFSNKEQKLLKSMKFPKEYDLPVNLPKVNWEVMKVWIANRCTSLLDAEDEVLIGYIIQQLEGAEKVDPRLLQINLTGFLEKNTSLFVKELWEMLHSASQNPSGIPQKILDEKAEEIRAKKEKQTEINERLKREREKAEEERRAAREKERERAEEERKARREREKEREREREKEMERRRLEREKEVEKERERLRERERERERQREREREREKLRARERERERDRDRRDRPYEKRDFRDERDRMRDRGYDRRDVEDRRREFDPRRPVRERSPVDLSPAKKRSRMEEYVPQRAGEGRVRRLSPEQRSASASPPPQGVVTARRNGSAYDRNVDMSDGEPLPKKEKKKKEKKSKKEKKEKKEKKKRMSTPEVDVSSSDMEDSDVPAIDKAKALEQDLRQRALAATSSLKARSNGDLPGPPPIPHGAERPLAPVPASQGPSQKRAGDEGKRASGTPQSNSPSNPSDSRGSEPARSASPASASSASESDGQRSSPQHSPSQSSQSATSQSASP